MTNTTLTAVPGSRADLKFNWVSASFFVAIHALAMLAPWFFSWSALGVCLFLHWLFGSIGICLGYHRLLTHRSLQVPKWLEYITTTIGTLALQGGPIFWVAGHRQHHAHPEDEVKDPYSARRGFWWSHMLWLVYQTPLGLLLYALGGWSFVIWGMFARAVLLWHSTWLINSATHLRGYQTYQVEDGSRNLWWAAILTYGEGWHNNHHAQPNVAPAGRQWWEVDPTWWAIQVLKTLGLATKVVMPPQRPVQS